MRKSVFSLMLLVGLLALVVGASFAQDATEEATMEAGSSTGTAGMGTVQCSSDLIASLYVAQRYFDFGRLNDQWMQSGASTLDLNQFDYGQYGPLFSNWSSMSSSQSPMWTDEQQNTVTGMMTLDDATFQSNVASMYPAGTDTTTMSTLNSSTLADEATECSTLRTQLNRFFQVIAFQDLNPNNLNTTGSDTGSTTEMTPEATAETSG